MVPFNRFLIVRCQALYYQPVICPNLLMYSCGFLKGCAATDVNVEQSGECPFLFFFSDNGLSASQAPSVVKSTGTS